MSEASIIESIERFLSALPDTWWCKHHGSPFSRRGVPDLLVCFRGAFFAFEVKQPTGKATASQVLQIRRINEAGGVAAIVTSVDEVRTVMQKVIPMMGGL